MRTSLASLAAVFAAAHLAACGSSKGGTTPPVDTAPLPTATSAAGIEFYPVARAGAPVALDPLPGWADVWVLGTDLSLTDYNQQVAPALSLFVGTPTGTPTVDSLATDPGLDTSLVTEAQTFGGLTFTGPVGAASTPPAVRATSDSFYSAGALTGPWAILGGTLVMDFGVGATTGTRLEQTLATGAVAAGSTLTVTWTEQGFVAGSLFLQGPAGAWHVSLRHPVTGALLADLDTEGEGSLATQDQSASVPGSVLAGLTQVTLSFELAGAADAAWVALDDVHADVDGGAELVTNGAFDPDLSGWTASAPGAPRRVVGSVRTVGTPHVSGDLQVTRSVYVEPAGAWARVVDLFHNPAASGTITTSAVYETALGAGTQAVVSSVPGTSGKAWSAWSTGAVVSDVAVVHGTATPYVRGVSAIDGFDGSDLAYSLFPLTVPAGGSRAVVHFVVLGTTATNADGNAALVTRPTAVEDVARAIVAGWSSTPTYRAYLSQAERDAVANF